MEKHTFKFQKTSRIIAIILSCVTALSATCITAFAEEGNNINKPKQIQQPSLRLLEK